VIPGRDEQQRRGARADPVHGEQARGAGGDQGDDEIVQAAELAVQELGAPSQFPQRDADGIARDVAGAGATVPNPPSQPSRPA
jgi:hypothetical protein